MWIHPFLIGLHIFLAIVWVGGILFVGWGVYPSVKSIKLFEQRTFLFSLMRKTHLLFSLAGAGVITTGFLLGTVEGPIRNWHGLLNTPFGCIWLTALIIALFTLIWGILAGYKQTMKMLSDDNLWELAENGNPKPLKSAMKLTAALESVEVIGFIALLVCMVLFNS